MIETITADYLQTKLSIPTSLEVPDPEPEEYIVIEKTGGGETDQLLNSTIAIQAVAQTLVNAAKLAEKIVKQMRSLPEDSTKVSRAEINAGPYNFTDTTTKRYRYQVIYDLVHYQEA